MPSEYYGPLSYHLFTWALVLMSVAIVNHWILHQRHQRNSGREALRFRVGLVSELRVLSDLYRLNLDLIEQGAGYLLSGRPPLVVCKGSMSRLPCLLDESVIGEVVAILARNEFIDCVLSARAQRYGNMTFRFPPRAGNLQDVKRYYLEGLEAIAAITVALERCPPEATSGTRWLFSLARSAQIRLRKSSSIGALHLASRGDRNGDPETGSLRVIAVEQINVRVRTVGVNSMRYRNTLLASVIFGFIVLSGLSPVAAQDQASPQMQPAAPSSLLEGSSVAPRAPSATPAAPGPTGGSPGDGAQSFRERVKAAREDCLQQAKEQGLQGPAVRQQVESCFATKMPDVAKRMACRREAMANGVETAGIPAYIRQCLAKKG